MKNDADYLLDSLLSDWHLWANAFAGVAGYGACAMFSGVKSSRQWDSEGEAADASLHNAEMRSIDFHVSELEPTLRTAIQLYARNMHAKRSVWRSARLPEDKTEVMMIVGRAKTALLERMGL